jgi:uncharacterized protein
MALISILAIGIMTVYAFRVEPYNLEVTETSFDFFGSEGNSLKIILISDVHGSYENAEFFDEAKEKINGLDADLILISGDIVGHRGEWGGISSLGDLESKYGTYAVLGNHDYNDWDCSNSENYVFADNVTAILEQLNITVLRNEHEQISINNRTFSIVGVDDRWSCMSNYSKASTGVPSTMPKIVLVHDNLAVQNESIRNGLVLSGHTHCGQVNLPFITKYIIEMEGYGTTPGGKGKIGDSDLYISCGLTPGGVRLFTRPEISVIYLE